MDGLHDAFCRKGVPFGSVNVVIFDPVGKSQSKLWWSVTLKWHDLAIALMYHLSESVKIFSPQCPMVEIFELVCGFPMLLITIWLSGFAVPLLLMPLQQILIDWLDYWRRFPMLIIIFYENFGPKTDGNVDSDGQESTPSPAYTLTTEGRNSYPKGLSICATPWV
jgi:hypothetical protein